MRLLVALVVLALVAACGDDDAGSGAGTDPEVTTTRGATGAPGALELAADLPDTVAPGAVTWTIEVRNSSDQPVTITFPTSQRGEAILRQGSTVVHRWSDGRFFAQVVDEVTIAAGATERIALDDDLSGVEPGDYELELIVTAQDSLSLTEPITVTTG